MSTIEIIYIKSYNANKTISAKQIRCKIFLPGRVCKLLEISSHIGDGLVFLFSKEEGVVRTSRACLLSVHTQFLSGQNKVKKVCGPKEGARAQSGAARCTYYEKWPEKS